MVGAIIFPGIDQADFTGPFEVLASMARVSFHLLAKTITPVRDARGLVLTPDTTFAQTPPLDVLVIPGGGGVNALMEDETVLAFVREQVARAKLVLSVCTGALVLGAAGLLRGRRATTHWASHHLLAEFGAIPVNARVVHDDKFVFGAGVTSGIDAALRVVARLRGDAAAQAIQLLMEYAPEPPFASGTPAAAPPEVAAAVRSSLQATLAARAAIAARVAAKLAAPDGGATRAP